MKNKVVVTKDNYKEIVLRQSIILCWILLAVCLLIKLLGGNFFAIICTKQNFISFCDYVDKHNWCKIVIGSISSLVTYSLFYLALARKMWFTKLETIWIFITTIIFAVLRIYINDKVIKFAINIIQLFVIPLFIERTYKPIEWFIPVLIYGNILNFCLQFISLIVKNVGIKILNDNFLIAFIFTIDLYIMLTLYYLYSNKKKEGLKMSWFVDWLFGKSETQLKEMKTKKEKKVAKLQEGKIAKLQEEIAQINAELEKKVKKAE